MNPQLRDSYETRGFAILHDFVPPDILEVLRGESSQLLQHTPSSQLQDAGCVIEPLEGGSLPDFHPARTVQTHYTAARRAAIAGRLGRRENTNLYGDNTRVGDAGKNQDHGDGDRCKRQKLEHRDSSSSSSSAPAVALPPSPPPSPAPSSASRSSSSPSPSVTSSALSATEASDVISSFLFSDRMRDVVTSIYCNDYMTAKDNAHHIADKSNAPATESNAPATATTVKDHGSNNNVVSVPIETKAAHGTSIKSCNEGTDNSDNSPTITTTDNNTKCDHDSGNVNACMEVGYFFNEHYVIKPPRCDDSAFGWHTDAAEQLKFCLYAPSAAPYISFWIALDDISDVNGPLFVLPRHLERDIFAPLYDDTVAATVTSAPPPPSASSASSSSSSAAAAAATGTSPSTSSLAKTEIQQRSRRVYKQLEATSTLDEKEETLMHAKSVCCRIKAGSCVVFDSTLWHCSSPNASSSYRRAYYAQYSKSTISSTLPSPPPTSSSSSSPSSSSSSSSFPLQQRQSPPIEYAIPLTKATR